jgi:hypothetical protein
MKPESKAQRPQIKQYTYTEFLQKFFPKTNFEQEEKEMPLIRESFLDILKKAKPASRFQGEQERSQT